MSGARVLNRVRAPTLPSWRLLRRRAIVAALLLVALLALYMLWLRDSSLVAVDRVEVTGAEGAAGVRAELERAASEMSTLHVDQAALEAAVADDPAVRSISASADFPHGLTIDVELREPVGLVATGSGEQVVAADGVALGAEDAKGLPEIEAAKAELSGGRVSGEALDGAAALGAAPAELAELIERARFEREHGLVVELVDGVEVRMGDGSRSAAKWSAAAAVLADPKLDGLTYVDVIVPSRPVAGTL